MNSIKLKPQIKAIAKSSKNPLQWFALLSPTGKIGTAIGLFLAVYAFASKISVTSSESLNPSNPFATPFIIRNDSLLSLKSVTIKCGLRDVKCQGAYFDNCYSQTRLPPIPCLKTNEPTTFLVPFPLRGFPVLSADIDIIVSYKPLWFPLWLPLKRQKVFRFSTCKSSNGTLHWIPRATSE